MLQLRRARISAIISTPLTCGIMMSETTTHRIEAERLFDALAAVERRHDVVVAAQALRDEAVHVGVVLDDQHARPLRGSRRRGPLRPPSA